MVPDEILVAFKDVKLAPEPEKLVAVMIPDEFIFPSGPLSVIPSPETGSPPIKSEYLLFAWVVPIPTLSVVDIPLWGLEEPSA